MKQSISDVYASVSHSQPKTQIWKTYTPIAIGTVLTKVVVPGCRPVAHIAPTAVLRCIGRPVAVLEVEGQPQWILHLRDGEVMGEAALQDPRKLAVVTERMSLRSVCTDAVTVLVAEVWDVDGIGGEAVIAHLPPGKVEGALSTSCSVRRGRDFWEGNSGCGGRDKRE